MWITAYKKEQNCFSAFEGGGYCCNPKYIAEELINREKDANDFTKYDMYWLVNDMTKEFPPQIKKRKIIYGIEHIIYQQRVYGLIMHEKIMEYEKEKTILYSYMAWTYRV